MKKKLYFGRVKSRKISKIKENSLNLSMQEYLPLTEKKEEKFDIADEINQIENLENLIIENIKKIKKHKI